MLRKRTTFLQLGLALAVGLFAFTSQAAPAVEPAQPAPSNNSDLPAGVTEEWLAAVREELGFGPLAPESLPDSASWYINGGQLGENFGFSVASAGDVNGDGWDDVIVGSPYYGGIDTGHVYIYHGGPTGLSVTPAWQVDGEVATSSAVHQYFGYSVGTAGDVNGDGYDDVIVGAPGYDYEYTWTYMNEEVQEHDNTCTADCLCQSPDGCTCQVYNCTLTDDWWETEQVETDVLLNNVGRVYVFHGGPTGVIAGSAADADFVATGEYPDDQFGYSVGTAGNVDGDGYADIVVGAPFADRRTPGDNGAGWNHFHDVIAEHLQFWPNRPPDTLIEANVGKVYAYHGGPEGVLVDNSPDWSWWSEIGEVTSGVFGWSVGTAGDVNNDGYADVIIGAPDADVPSGGEGKAYVYYGSAWHLSETAVWTDEAGANDQNFGISVGTAGDVNGDGYDDIIVGDSYAGADNNGAAYVYHGSDTFPSATPDWTASGTQADDLFGHSVGTAGDTNGDGYDDVIVGAPDYDVTGPGGNEGRTYVHHGSAAGLSGTPDWSGYPQGDGGEFGYSVGTAGDVNGDGYADVIVGDYWWEAGDKRGGAYAYYGRGEALAIVSAGDVNGDGYADVIVGSYGDNNYTGKAEIYFGPNSTWSSPDKTLTGGAAGDYFGWSVAGAGDVNGDGYDDVIVGAPYAGTTNGAAIVFFGASGTTMDMTPDGTIVGTTADDHLGWSVAGAGDVNCDGYADVIVGVPGDDNVGTDAGRANIYHGATGATLDPTADWTATGENTYDYFGNSVGTAGDVNGDGWDDVIVGAYRYALTDTGKVYIYHGATGTTMDATADWSTWGSAGDRFGNSVGTAGDVNGDGFADVIIGAYHSGSDNQGSAYVYHGGSAMDTASDWNASGENANDYFGRSVGTAGDVNGDGYADVIVGADGYDASYNAGKVYLYHGGPLGLGTDPDWTDIGTASDTHLGLGVGTAGDFNGDGYADFVAGGTEYSGGIWQVVEAIYFGAGETLDTEANWSDEGEDEWDYFGYSVAAAGDVNGDGYTDVIVGAYGYDNWSFRGRAYIYYGSTTGLSTSPALTLTGEANGDYFGNAVATAGDVNSDGYADVIVGAYRYGSGQGKVYVYYGGSAMDATADWTATGENAGDYFGKSVACAGDVDGDGYADVVVGAYGYDDYRGRAYLYKGSYNGLEVTPGWIDTETNPDWTASGENGWDFFGYAVAGAGDVNGDGYADVIVGAKGYDDLGARTDAGKVYVYYGDDTLEGLSVNADFVAVGENEGDNFGNAVGTAGDVNADSFADVIVGAYRYTSGDYQGKVYVYHGALAGLSGPVDWFVTGEDDDDWFGSAVGTAGDVNGDGYADVLVGAGSYDNGANSDAGRAYVYHGGSTMDTTADWSASGEHRDDWFAYSAATAGDVDGDGYADVIVGAYRYTSGNNQGKVYVYQGNDGGGRIVHGLQLLSSAVEVVQPWGSAEDANSFRVRMNATDPMAGGQVRLQVQACENEEPFGGSCSDYYSSWENVPFDSTGYVFTVDIDGLDVNTLYRWRARVQYAPRCGALPHTPPHGPWRRFMGQGLEADISTRVTDLEIQKTATIPVPLPLRPYELFTYTLDFINLGPGIATDILITDVVPSPTFTVKSWDSSLGVGVGITDTKHVPLFVWEVPGPLAVGQSEVITITGFITHTSVISDPLYMSPGEYVFTDTAEINVDVNATDVRDVFQPLNNFSSAAVEYFVPPPVGGYTEMASPLALLWPRVAILVAAAGGGVAGLTAVLKKRQRRKDSE